jgi:hypothetical protein
VRVWVEDLQFHLAMAMRAVGVGLAAVAWTSVLVSEAQQSGDVRNYALVGAALLSVLITQLFTAQPPSATVVDLLRPLERDIIAVARERAGGDEERLELLVTRVAMLAAARMQRGAVIPRDRRAWLRTLARLASSQ